MLNFMHNRRFAQMAFVTNDVERAKVVFSKLFGFDEVPPTCGIGTPEIAKTEYKGRPAPEIDCKIAYFDFGNIQIELMEPNDVPSAWRDVLNEKGECLHHISFFVKDMDARILDCECKGMTLVQRGIFAENNGQYAYLDTNGQTPYMIELLEYFGDMKDIDAF